MFGVIYYIILSLLIYDFLILRQNTYVAHKICVGDGMGPGYPNHSHESYFDDFLIRYLLIANFKLCCEPKIRLAKCCT